MFISNLGVWLLTVGVLGFLGSSVKVLSLSESISNESSVLSKIPASGVSVAISLHLADLHFYKVSLVCDKVWG